MSSEDQQLINDALGALRLYKRYYSSGDGFQAKKDEIIALVHHLSKGSKNAKMVRAMAEAMKEA